jgi:EmrB/QacA subfamily drug resistance transporter
MPALGSRRWWALGALIVSLLTIGFDATILNVALPTLATSLHASTGSLQWMVDAYVLVFAGLLLPMGALGDRYGRKRLMMIGLVLFGASSVIATYARSTGPLIGARAAMGVGAAILTPITLAVIPAIFRPEERSKAISLAAIGMGVGVPLGPIIGGYLLKHFWYGSVFLVNVPVAVLALVAVAVLVPESKDPGPRRVDVVGGLLSTGGLVGFVYGVIEAPARGWTSGLVLAAIGGGLVLLAAFVWWERRAAGPMIDLALFARPRFLWGSLAATVASFGLFGLLFVLPQFLQAVQGRDALETGVRLMPIMLGLIMGVRASEALAARVGARIPVAAGMFVVAGGLALGATTSVDSGYALIGTWLSIIGIGVGLTLAPAMSAVLAEVPEERSGSGTALTMTLRQIGGALGVALLGSISAAAYTDRLHLAGLPGPAADAARDSISGAVAVAAQLGSPGLLLDARLAYVHAMSVVLLVCAAIAVLGGVLVGLFMPARGNPPKAARVGRAQEPQPSGESEHELARVA